MCDERERLIGYVYDECDAEERRRIERHLEGCGTCRTEIGGLRDVRQDLLAWGVPPHESIWRPFVPAQPAPWWRQVPAWAMAAAASVMFLMGAAGAVVTHALVLEEPAATSVDAEHAVPAVAVTPVELSAAEQRILRMLRGELESRVQRVALSARPARIEGAALDSTELNRQLIDLASDRDWQMNFLRTLYKDFSESKTSTDAKLQSLTNKVDTLVMTQSGGGR